MSGGIRDVLLECLTLKELARTGWVRSGVKNPESVASHSWGVAWLAAVLCPKHLDRGKAVTIAVIHDIAEVRVGDITPNDGISKKEKAERELSATRDLLSDLDEDGTLFELWLDYENERTPEGRFAKACDKLDMALQASLYSEKYGVDLSQFVESALDTLKDEELRQLAGE